MIETKLDFCTRHRDPINHKVYKHFIECLYVGYVVPNKPEYRNAKFSNAINMFQENLIAGLKNAGLSINDAFCVRRMPYFPKHKSLFVPGSKDLLGKTNIYFVPFINIILLKEITVGIVTFIRIILWCITKQKVKNKVILIFNLDNTPSFMAFLAAKICRTKIIAQICDIYLPGTNINKNPATMLNYWLQKRYIPKFDGLSVVHKGIIDDYSPLSKHIILEGGIGSDFDFERIRNYRLKVNSLKNKTTNVTYAGYLSEIHNIPLLINTIKLLKDEDIIFHVAGKGPLEKEILELVKHYNNINYHGLLSIEELEKLYAQTDIFLSLAQSRWKERFPSKVFEYFATGIPVISTCIGNLEAEFTGKAFFLHEESPQKLAELIVNTSKMEEKVRLKIGYQARNYVLSKKSWNLQSQKLFNLIQEISL